MLAVLLLSVVSVSLSAPENVAVGELVVIDGSVSVGDNFKWVSPSGLEVMISQNRKLAFVAVEKGSFDFFLVAADSSAAIAIDNVTIKVGDKQPTAPESGAIVVYGNGEELTNWINTMQAALVKMGWVVQTKQGTTLKAVVQFPNGKVFNHEGFLDSAKLVEFRRDAYK